MISYREKKERWAKFCESIYWDWANKERKAGNGIPSQRQFCETFDLPHGSWGHWVTRARLPDDENKRIMADRFGPKVYEILDEPMISWFFEKLNDRNRQILLDEAERLVKEQHGDLTSAKSVPA